jgi:hypothetical protein
MSTETKRCRSKLENWMKFIEKEKRKERTVEGVTIACRS